MASARAAAFFDLDRTLIPGSANFALARAAFRTGMVPPLDLAKDAANAVVFVLRGASDARSEALRDRILHAVAGHHVDELAALGDRIVPGLVGSVFPEAQAELDRHAAAGRDRVLVSASPIEVVQRLADALGLEGAVGTRAEVVGGRYTGRLSAPFCYGPAKPAEVQRLADRHGYQLSRSYAYSDSISDEPFLRCVGVPVAFNPDDELRMLAADEGWRTVEVSTRTRSAVGAVSRVVQAGRALATSARGLQS